MVTQTNMVEAAPVPSREEPRSRSPEAADIMKYLDSFQALKNYFDSIQGFEVARNTRGDSDAHTDQDIDTHSELVEGEDDTVDNEDGPGGAVPDLIVKLQPNTLETDSI